MAVQTPPFVLQNSSHGSELVRREALASLVFGSAGGVVPATPAVSANITAGVAGCSDLKVNAPASGMSCLLNPGQIYVPGSLGSGSGYGIGTGYGMPTVTLNGGAAPTVAPTAKATAVQLTTQGIYYCYNDNSAGQVSLTVAASNATNPRIDVVIAQVEDASYSGANNDWMLAIVTGTAAASPTVPALPANAVVLAYLWIPAASTSVTAGNILDLRFACNRNPFHAFAQTSTQALVAGDHPLIATSVLTDLVGSYNNSTGLYTAPVTGRYSVQGEFLTVSTSSTIYIASLLIGGGVSLFSNQTTSNANGISPLMSTTTYVNANQTLAVGIHAATSGGALVGVTGHNWVSFTLLSPL